MSRSRRKHPCTWICTVRSGEMKKWKSKQNRILRRTNEEIPNGSYYKRKSEIYTSPSDGKIWGIDHWFFGTVKNIFRK